MKRIPPKPQKPNPHCRQVCPKHRVYKRTLRVDEAARADWRWRLENLEAILRMVVTASEVDP